MIAGTVYGAALNDREQHRRLAGRFETPPYKKPPERPILYIKPRNCLTGDHVMIPPELDRVEAAATLGLLIGKDACRVTKAAALDHVSGICLALDISAPYDDFYRPPIRQRCRDGFLRLGALAPFDGSLLSNVIETFADGAPVQQWAPSRLVRDPALLIADISAFMTLAAGDLLLIGLADGAPHLAPGTKIDLRCGPLPPLAARLSREPSP